MTKSIEINYTLPNDPKLHHLHFHGHLRHLRYYLWRKTQGKRATIKLKVNWVYPK